MQEITAASAAEYLRRTGRVGLTEPVEVRELSGGVSNVVLHVSLPARGEGFVVKQARPQLRVAQEWLCPIERIWQETATLRAYQAILHNQESAQPVETLPQILWEDEANYAYAMTAAPPKHQTWKQRLLGGDLASSQSIARACGYLLGQLHAGSWNNRDLPVTLYNRTYFDQLRLDPYYRQIARVHPDLAPPIENLIESVGQNRNCLVHGDFSPKNLLVWPGHVMLIDFEVGHYGDPAFDLGFFLTHLILKAIWAGPRRDEYLQLAGAFWHAYQSTLSPMILPDEFAVLERRAMLNLAGCLLARVDGKSPVDYLTISHQHLAGALSRRWLADPPISWNAAMHVLSTEY